MRVTDIRYELRSNEVQDIYRLTKEFQKNFSTLSFLPVLIPSLNKLPKCIKNVVFKENLFDQFLEEMRSVVEKTVDKHLEDYNPYNPRDLIDEYIKGMKESKGDKYSFFRKGALYQIVFDLFQTGSDTVNNMLKWVAFLLARYPDYRKRMQEQIDKVVPRDRMVSLDEKPSGTKYTAPKQGFFAFGSGRRQCAGELLARMELFLFTAAITQNFDILPVEGVDLGIQEFSSIGHVRLPLDQKFIYMARK
ncbi:Cytochrome P450 [Trinorchestia longiramus]|nr:Cytochrome P450 [Trinorchestia longiramus]